MWCSVSPLHIQRQRLRSSRLTPHTCYGSLCEYMAHGCAKAYVCVLHSSSRAPLLVPWLGDVEGTSLYTVRPRVAKYNIYIHTSYIYSPKKSNKDSPVCICNLYLQLGGRTWNLELALDLGPIGTSLPLGCLRCSDTLYTAGVLPTAAELRVEL